MSQQHTIILLIGLCFVAIYIIWNVFFKQRKQYFSRPIITKFETRMFVRLHQAFPHHHILTQVAFSALITSEDYKFRNQFNRKVTDFVITTKSMQVVAIIELDDPSHKGKEQEDAFRDYMLNQAGYRVFRYTAIPSTTQLRKDLLS
ncbi:DUF2726 domain-containing protein [Acinetobacter sp. B10A]|uniref:DUF2726 domain-containing protein n=1 Tax=Acinetobacter baretiae TaxID=2605383 RepID=UPI001B3C9D97|nr:DUF2726 domain-containing protein [Acinetobacter baretiae]MBF7684908.1 DUF2726 domain-containing protein [Acinetobacter baretiae]